MSKDNFKEWLIGTIGLVVGGIGAFIESWDLHSDLFNRYPFKVMSVPPAQFYFEVSNTIAFFAPYLSILAGLIMLMVLKRKKFIAGVMPVIICPLTYVFGLWYFVSNSSYVGQLNQPINYDESTAAMHHQTFNLGAVKLSFFSIFVYLVFLGLLYGINYKINSKKMS